MSKKLKMAGIPPFIGEEPLVGRYYMAECKRCGWLGCSSELTDECECTREEGGDICLGDTLVVDAERLFEIIQAMAKQAGQVPVIDSEKPSTSWSEPCKQCGGEGSVHTGITEAPTTLCERCKGCGKELTGAVEREKFEAAALELGLDLSREVLRYSLSQFYADNGTERSWRLWQARAALEVKP